jgi:TonB-linked SusC/RagA family outer membrane protein
VTDDAGTPLENVAVSLRGQRLGTLTDEDGRFNLVVPTARFSVGDPLTVEATLLGYRTHAESITLSSGTNQIDFELALDPVRLDEIIAVGQGMEAQRRKLGVTVGAVDEQTILDSQDTNIVDALTGKVAGVNVHQAGGEAMAGSYIVIRGPKSVEGGTQPLFVVDGTPVSNSTIALETVGGDGAGSTQGTAVQNRAADINPADVESIEILKGPAAAAIYGSAGSNGAVLITTRQGAAGQSQIMLKFRGGPDNVNYSQPLQSQFGRDGPGSARSWGTQLDCFPNCVVGVDVFDHAWEMFDQGRRLQGDANFSGGGQRTSYFVSFSYLDQNSAMEGNSSLSKFTTRVKGSYDFLDNLTFAGNIAYTNQDGDMIQQGSNISGLLLGAFRTVPEYNNCPDEFLPNCWLNQDGLHHSYRNPEPTSVTERRGYDNPFWVANEIRNTAQVGHTFGNLRLDWEPFRWFAATWIGGVDYFSDQRLTLFPKSSSEQPDGRVMRATFQELNIDSSLLGTFSWNELTQSVGLNFTAGWNIRSEESRNIDIQGDRLILGTEQTEFAVDRTPNEFTAKAKTQGFFGDLSLDIADQLFIAGGVRYEGSNTFGIDQSYFLYPSASVAWEWSQLVDANWLSFAKLRGAYGEAGRPPPIFSNLSSFETEVFGDGWVNVGLETIYAGQEGVVTDNVAGNEFIDPERTREYEGGLEMAFLDSRLSFGVTYYQQFTSDAIIFLPVAPSSGAEFLPFNGAEWNNKGWEVNLGLIPVQGNTFQWEINANWSKNNSVVTDLLGAEAVFLSGFTDPGPHVVFDKCGPANDSPCEFGEFRGSGYIRFGRGIRYDWDGDGVANDIDAEFPNATPGAAFIGPDGLPVFDPQERQMGNPNPLWLAGLRTTFRLWQDLRITAFFDWKQGGQMWNGTKGALFYFGTHEETVRFHGDGVDEAFTGFAPWAEAGVDGPGAGTVINVGDPFVGFGDGNSFTGPSEPMVEDASYVKWRDVSISYTNDGRWLHSIGFNRIELMVGGANLITWTDYTGLDPDANLTSQTVGRGFEYFNNPQIRSFTFAISLIR